MSNTQFTRWFYSSRRRERLSTVSVFFRCSLYLPCNLFPFVLFVVFPGHRWPEYLVVGETEPSSSTSSGDDKSELMGVQGQVEPDVMMQAFMDHFEVFSVLFCIICSEMLLFIQ
jgi:hypothetical protein